MMLYHLNLEKTNGQTIIVHHERLIECFPGNEPGVTICVLAIGHDQNDTYVPVSNTTGEIETMLEDISNAILRVKTRQDSGV